MALIGVFALNISENSGGVYRLIDGLMHSARHSEHRFLFVCEKTDGTYDFPKNVQILSRSRYFRLATQALFRVPGIQHVLTNPHLAKLALAAAGALPPSIFSSAKFWLFPHCFSTVPNVGRTLTICHDMIHLNCPEYFDDSAIARRREGERSLNHCAAVLCPSRSTIEDLLAVYPEYRSKTHLFYEAPVEIVSEEESADEFEKLQSSYAKTGLFIFVGVDWPHKNHQLLIQAARHMKEMTDSDFRIVLMGSRRENKIAGMIRDTGVEDVVSDIGPVTREQLGAYYRSATALVFPSLYEGFGIPLAEAMHYGLPIIAGDRSCIPEICGDAAVILPPDDPKSWAAEMLRMMLDENHRAQHVERSNKRRLAFTWENSWKGIDKAINYACGANAEMSINKP